MHNCELYEIIPKDKIKHIVDASGTALAECDSTFLGFEDAYKAVTLFVPKDKVILDLGCSYAFQSWYFRSYKRYIGVDCGIRDGVVLETENSEFYFMTIQDFIKNILPTLGYDLREIFAICAYVPDEEARQMVRETFPSCLIYYP